jgi:hypothetical protein
MFMGYASYSAHQDRSGRMSDLQPALSVTAPKAFGPDLVRHGNNGGGKRNAEGAGRPSVRVT